MKKKITYLLVILFGYSSCQLPELENPAFYYSLIALLRSNTPEYRLSIVYNGREYHSGETLELGMAEAFDRQVIPVILKNTGNREFSLLPDTAPVITSQTNGELSLESSAQVPVVWQPGSEISIDMQIMPGAAEINSWNISLDILTPETITSTFNVRMLTTIVHPKKLFFGVYSPVSDIGLYSMDWNSESTSLGAPFQLSSASQSSFGGAKFSSANKGRFIYYVSSNTTVDGFRLDAAGMIVNTAQLTLGSNHGTLYGLDPLKRLAIVSNIGGVVTAPFNIETGTLGALSPSLGMLCSSGFLIPSPKGDFIFENHYYHTSFIGWINVKRIAADGSLTNVYNSPNYYEDPIVPNRLSLSFKTRDNDYLYTASKTGAPTGLNYKVDSILRRTVNSDGTLSSVDKEFTLNAMGAAYNRVIRHPNDKFIYLIGVSSGTQGIVHVLNHDRKSGDITKSNTLIKADAQNALDGAVSPDGKFLAIMYRVNASACPTCQENIHVYSIDPVTGDLTEKYSVVRNQQFNGIFWMGQSSR